MKAKGWTTAVVLFSLLLAVAGVSRLPALAARVSESPTGPSDLALATTIHVDAGATGGNDGTSWPDAYTDLQSALAVAASGDQVWVAEGTYKPAQGTDRTLSFQLETGVKLYGGFPAGGGDGTFAARDFGAYPTILSGDIGAPGDIDDNSHHVVNGSGANATALLDGFTITAGNAPESGGTPASNGGGVYVVGSSPTIANCTLQGNRAGYGGGAAYFQSSSSLLHNVVFSSNYAGAYGGGIYLANSSVQIFNATLLKNSVPYDGGAFYTDGGDPKVVNTVFAGNTAVFNGGGVRVNSGNPSLINVTLYGNRCTHASGYGGGLWSHSTSSPGTSVRNAILWGNISTYSSQIHNAGGLLTVQHSLIQGGYAGTGNISLNPRFVDPDGADDVIGTPDDDLRLHPTSPAIDAGDNSAVPADAADLDDDGNTTEPTPLDRDGNPRFIDQPGIPDTGIGTPPLVDKGAYEVQRTCWVKLNDDPADYQTVQAAVDASTDAGDLVKVAGYCAGVNTRGGLRQTVYVSKTLTIQGGYSQTFSGPPDPEAYPTVLDAAGLGRALYITGEAAGDPGEVQPTVQGLQITGGYPLGLGGWGQFGERDGGGGVYIIGATATISGCRIHGNTAEAGAGLAIALSDAQLVASQVYSNAATGVGGGGLAIAEGSPNLRDNQIQGNSSTGGHGGGVWAIMSSLSVLENQIFANTTDEAGGGLYLWDCVGALVRGNTIEGNQADYDGGGVALDGGAALVVEDNVIRGNASGGDGGGLRAGDIENLLITGNTVTSNTTGDHGGGLALPGFYSVTLSHNLVHGNSSGQEGGGVSVCCGDVLVLSDNQLFGNESGQAGGGLAGSLALTVTLTGNQVHSNSAGRDGGGLWLLDSGAVLIDANTVSTNTAGTEAGGHGGGLYLGRCLTVTVSTNDLYGNTALYLPGEDNGGEGGGLGLQEVEGLVASNRLWDNSGGLGGGGMALTQSALIVRGNTVEDNSAAEDGGGVWAYEVDGSRFEENVIRRNVGAYGGGLALVPHGETWLSHNLIAENTAEWAGGMLIAEGYASLDGDRVLGNVAEYAGGLALEWCDLDAVNVVVADNQDSSWDADGISVYSSIVRMAHSTIARNGDGAGLYLDMEPGVFSSVAMTNTVLVNHPIGLYVAGGNTVTMKGVLWDPATPITATVAPTATVTILHQRVGVPAFDADGYHLTEASAAVDQGVDSGVSTDVDGDPRPYGMGYDLGADELIYGTPIEGLIATNDSPTVLGGATTLTATITAGEDVSYNWDLGNGAVRQGPVVTFVYPQVGVYSAVVTASNNVNQLVASTTVTITDAPIAGLAATNDSPTELGQTTHLTASITAGSNVSYVWNLGDGTDLVVGRTVSHVYGQVGVYTARVTATNSVGEVSASTLVTIVDRPVTGLVATNDGPTALEQPTHLTATVTGGSNVVFDWDFGDSSPHGIGAAASHVYGEVGIYTATVTASNGSSLLTATTRVTVIDVPIAGLVVVSDSPTELGYATNLTATVSAGTGVLYTWDFGDGSPPQTGAGTFPGGSALRHTYPAVGTYQVIVTATNSVNQQTAGTLVQIWVRECYVRLNDSPTVYDTVQAAVNASTDPADVVKVSGTCRGVQSLYTQQVYLDKTLTIRGGYSSDFGTWDPSAYPTVLDAEGLGRVVYLAYAVTPYTPTLEALHLTNGYNLAQGGGLHAAHSNVRAVISGCHIYGNTAREGAGLYLYSGATVINSQIYSNTADYSGGGIYLNGAHGATLTGNQIHHNTAGSDGAGIYGRNSTAALLANNQIYDNQASFYGGGCYLTQTTGAALAHNTFSNNQGGGAAVYLYLNTSVTLESNEMVENRTGTAVYLNSEHDALLAGNQLVGNRAGAVGIYASTRVTLTGNVIQENWGAQQGTGVYVGSSADVTLSANQVKNNQTDGLGGGIYLYDSSRVTLIANRIENNSAVWYGGGIRAQNCDQLIVQGNVLYRNRARAGGAMEGTGLTDLLLVNNVVAENSLTPLGSGAGGLELYQSNVQMAHNTLVDNQGWGIYLYLNAHLTMTNNIMAGHLVGLYLNMAQATLDSTLWGAGDWANGEDWAAMSSEVVTETASIWGDPAFVDPVFGNYHILLASAAVDVGVDAGVTVDIDGDPRPSGAGFDIGADEVTPDDPVTGLAVFNNSPMELRDVTVLSATVTGGENVVFNWDLGDGQRGHGAVVEHVYPAVGSYTAVVTASNSTNALMASTRVTITHNTPIAGLALTADSPTPLHLATYFTATVAEGSNVVYDWYFGDGTPPVRDAGPAVNHTYSAVGGYTAVVTASNSLSVDTGEIQVQVVRTCWVRLNDDATDYQTVHAAISASWQATDVVKVAGLCVDSNPKNGQPQVNLNKELTIRGGYSADFSVWNPQLYPTTLDANGDAVVIFTHGLYTPTVEFLRLTNATQHGAMLQSGHAVVRNCEIDHNGSGPDARGGVFVYDSARAVLTGNQIHHNQSTGFTGGVMVYYSPDARLVDNAIYANTAAADPYSGGGQAGGVSLTSCPRCQLVDNEIFDNIALGYGWGGGVQVIRGEGLYSDDVLLAGNHIHDNVGHYGGGIYFFGYRGVLRDNWFYRNVAAGTGGGVRLSGTDVLLVNNMIVENVGGGLTDGVEINGGTVRMVHNTIAGNRGAYLGTGISLSSGSVSMTNTIVVGHSFGVYVSPGNPATTEGTLWGTGAWANDTDYWGALVTGTVNLWGNPAFLDPANLNYRIGPLSAARDAGVNAGITTDIDGQPRPNGPGFDMGADEYVPDIPIQGLAAENDGPTRLGAITRLTATITAGTNVVYAWQFGDGATGNGQQVSHTYLTAGVYTATVTATNMEGQATASTRVTVYQVVTGIPGGSQTTSDGALDMAWSPEMSGSMIITYTPQVSSNNLTGEFQLAGLVFHLEAVDQYGNPITNLTTPITLTVHYDESALPAGADEADLELLRYDTVLSAWVKPPQTLNTAANTIVVVLDHLSEFVLAVRVDVGTKLYLPVVLRK